MMYNYDVIVIGAGPAGGKCAMDLAKKGISVLLVEKFLNFEQNNFSSAGMLYETIDEFSLPQEVIATNWSNLVIQTTKKTHLWKGEEKQGVVLDFGKLKKFYAEECQKNSGSVLLGHRYESKKISENGVEVNLIDTSTNESKKYKSKIVVDATGPARKVIYNHGEKQPEMLVGTGVEYLIEVEEEIYNKHKNNLTFFLGEKWANLGYSWVFPMNNNCLKVGSGRIVSGLNRNLPLKQITENIIHEYIGTETYKILDIHGGSLKYSLGMKDIFYKNRIVCIGDAVSTVNPLGGEGIRYAIENAQLSVPFIIDFVNNGKNKFAKFEKKWKRKYYWKWLICEILCKRIYTTYTDEKIENRLSLYREMSNTEDVLNNFFRFKFNNFKWKIFTFLFKKMTSKLLFKKSKLL
jgi:digeranylgeranylglycerophospholipid reductase